MAHAVERGKLIVILQVLPDASEILNSVGFGSRDEQFLDVQSYFFLNGVGEFVDVLNGACQAINHDYVPRFLAHHTTRKGPRPHLAMGAGAFALLGN
jgi:hypothetical protein